MSRLLRNMRNYIHTEATGTRYLAAEKPCPRAAPLAEVAAHECACRPAAAAAPRRTLAARLLGDRAALGYLLIVLATISFGTNNNLTKESYQHGVSVDMVLAGRSWFLALLLALWFAAHRSLPSFPRGTGYWVLFAVLLFSLNGWALMSAFDRMSVSLSILIFYLFPFMVGLMAAALRIEPLRPAMLIGLAVAFAGLFLA
ncbi:MAG: DMT family transporter, partial [Rhodospirillaceae bacterium]|nr:DMT family transporter [Rhodospirillaceae bacterium]